MTSPGIAVRPIKTAQDHEDAVGRIGELIGAAPDSAEGDELDLLATLVDAYERKHFPVDAPDPLVAIEFRMEQLGLTRKDLEPMIGSRARVSEILNGKRNLTLEMVRKIKTGLGIPADVLIGPVVSRTKRSAKGRGVRSNTAKAAGERAAGRV